MELPHIELISDSDWDPSVLDYEHNLSDESVWYEALAHPDSLPPKPSRIPAIKGRRSPF